MSRPAPRADEFRDRNKVSVPPAFMRRGRYSDESVVTENDRGGRRPWQPSCGRFGKGRSVSSLSAMRKPSGGFGRKLVGLVGRPLSAARVQRPQAPPVTISSTTFTSSSAKKHSIVTPHAVSRIGYEPCCLDLRDGSSARASSARKATVRSALPQPGEQVFFEMASSQLGGAWPGWRVHYPGRLLRYSVLTAGKLVVDE